MAPQGKDPLSHSVSYFDPFSLSPAGKLRRGLLKLRVERCLEVWIQFHEDFVRRCCRRRLLRSEMGCTKANQVGLMGPIDGVDRVIYGAVHDGKAAGGVDGCRLRAGGSDND